MSNLQTGRETPDGIVQAGKQENGVGQNDRLATKRAEEPQVQEEILYCVNHPNTDTLLRCNRCGKPVCMKCVQLTDVGYRCHECIRGVQDSYFNAESMDNPIAFGVAFIVAAIGAPVVGMLLGGFGFFGFLIAFMLGSGAGGLLAQIVRKSIGRRRGRYLRYFALGGIITGVLVGNLVLLLTVGAFPIFSLATLLFTILASITAYQMLR